LGGTVPLSPPVQLSAVYGIRDLAEVDALYSGESRGFVYARDGHPNGEQLASTLAEMEGAESGLVCASGMGALTSVLLALIGTGDEIAISSEVYGKTTALVCGELSRFGVHSTNFDAGRAESLDAAIRPKTRAIVVETISNPLLRVADLAGLARVARSRGVAMIVDHTMAPLLCPPIALGADVVLHSLTKFIGGHSDAILGAVVGERSLIASAARVCSTLGINAGPFESWLVLRGMSTLGVRWSRMCETALDLAERFATNSRVRAVHYPGLAGHPDHSIANEIFVGGYGAMLTIDLGNRESADRLIRNLSRIPFAPSFGDVSTTVSHPATTSHRALTDSDRERIGITHGLVRVSVGLESAGDIWREFECALESAA
jgi:cystathionine beta-lyase/cystathionine gamma-synthase